MTSGEYTDWRRKLDGLWPKTFNNQDVTMFTGDSETILAESVRHVTHEEAMSAIRNLKSGWTLSGRPQVGHVIKAVYAVRPAQTQIKGPTPEERNKQQRRVEDARKWYDAASEQDVQAGWDMTFRVLIKWSDDKRPEAEQIREQGNLRDFDWLLSVVHYGWLLCESLDRFNENKSKRVEYRGLRAIAAKQGEAKRGGPLADSIAQVVGGCTSPAERASQTTDPALQPSKRSTGHPTASDGQGEITW